MDFFKSILKAATVALLLLGATTLVSASEDPKEEAAKQVRTKVTELIAEPYFLDNDVEKMESMVYFMITEKDEIVVLYVDTDHVFAEQFIKERLNYEKVSDSLLRGRYAMKITLKNGSI